MHRSTETAGSAALPGSAQPGSPLPEPASPDALTAAPGRFTDPGLRLLLLAATLALLAFAAVASLAVGSHQLPFAAVLESLRTELAGGGSTYADDVIASRIPRTLLGILAGAGLAVAGVIMQGLTRNPLADPGILGVNAGAAAALVTGLAFLGAESAGTNVWIALPGAALAVVVVYGIASGRGGATPVRLVLAGTVVTAMLMAYIQAIALTRPDVFTTYRFWAVGSLSGRTMEHVTATLPFFLVGLVLTLGMGRFLDVLALGDESAKSLGLHPTASKLLGITGATLLCAAATAAVGPIGFIGLAVPHIVRAFTGPSHRWLLAFSVLLGPSVLLLADVLGRIVARPSELLTGVVTAILGAPMLIVAVRRMRALT